MTIFHDENPTHAKTIDNFIINMCVIKIAQNIRKSRNQMFRSPLTDP